MGQAFISYAREDESIARELYDDLQRRGGKPWLDRIHLTGGELWAEGIKKAMGDSAHIIALMSKHSLGTWIMRQVQQEFADALRVRREKYPGKTYVIPVRLAPTEPGGFVNWLRGLSDLKDIHWIEWSDPEGKKQIWKALTCPRLHPE